MIFGSFPGCDKKEEKPKKDEKSSAEKKPAEEAPAEEEPTEEEPVTTEENVQMHSYVQNIDIGHPKFLTKGSVVMIGEGWVTYEYYSNETGRMTTTTVKRKSVKLI